MQEFRDRFAATIGEDEHVAMMLDQAGWHQANDLATPHNITLIPLPPYSPEINPVERICLYLKERFLSQRLHADYNAIVEAGSPSAMSDAPRASTRCVAFISSSMLPEAGAESTRSLLASRRPISVPMRASSSPTSPVAARPCTKRVYCQRGTAENLIKDMKRTMRSDKTACSRWEANQFRLFLHMGAYWLLHALRRAAPKRSRWRGATLETIRRTFVKIAVRVEELKSKIKLAFPAAYPHQVMLATITGTITANGP